MWPRNRDVEAGGGLVTLFWIKTEVRPLEDDADGGSLTAELYTLEVGTLLVRKRSSFFSRHRRLGEKMGLDRQL